MVSSSIEKKEMELEKKWTRTGSATPTPTTKPVWFDWFVTSGIVTQMRVYIHVMCSGKEEDEGGWFIIFMLSCVLTRER